MKILLVSATKFEVNPLLKKLQKVSKKADLLSYRAGKHSVDILITGVGMTATAFYLGKQLSKSYDLAINAGVAGSFKKSILPGEVVNITHDRFGDLGAEDGTKFITLSEMRLGKVPNLTPIAIGAQVPSLKFKSLRHLKKVKGISVNTVHGNSASIKKVVKKFKPDVESMEGAAFFFACQEFKTPCVQVRAISNYVERRNKKNWKLELAVKNLNYFLERMLQTI